MREIGEAEIFEYCVCLWRPELELFIFFLFLFFDRRKSRRHGREPILAILKLFLLKLMFFIVKFNSNLSPFKIEKKKSFFRGFSIFRFREAILAILKLFLLKSMFFSVNFNRNLSPFKIDFFLFFRGFRIFRFREPILVQMKA